jgi:hypothetical protein
MTHTTTSTRTCDLCGFTETDDDGSNHGWGKTLHRGDSMVNFIRDPKNDYCRACRDAVDDAISEVIIMRQAMRPRG